MIVSLPTSSIAALIREKWDLIPLRVPTGWSIRWNSIVARRLSTGEYEINDSQDLFSAVHDRKVTLDGGYYGDDGFRICVLEPDWDNVTDKYTTVFFDDFVWKLELRLIEIANRGTMR